MFKTTAAALSFFGLLLGAGPGHAQVRSPLAEPSHYSVFEVGPGNELFAQLLICRSSLPGTRMECVTSVGNAGMLALTRVYRRLRAGVVDPPAAAEGFWPPHAKSFGAQLCWATNPLPDGRRADTCEVPSRDWPAELAADYETALRAIRARFRREYGR